MPRLGSGIELVGRAKELEQLRAALARATGGSATAVLLSGDAGIGKSRLLYEFGTYADADSARIITGRCVDIGESGLAYLPFAEAVAEATADAPDLQRRWPALARLLSGATSPAIPASPGVLADPLADLPPDPDTGISRLQVFEAVIGLLTELAAVRPTVLAIEDLHWADSSTRDLVSFILARLRHQRLLVLITYRSDDLHRRHPLRPLLAELVRIPAVERLDLTPLESADSHDFVAALLDDGAMSPDVAQEVAKDIVGRSDGNPFFAEELVVAATEQGGELPWTLSELLLTRIERLGAAAQLALKAASVAGRRVRTNILSAVVDLPDLELEGAMREAVQHYVLVTSGADDEYSFRHALLAEAIYSDLLPGERVRLHAAYAGRLTAEQGTRGVSAELAFHCRRSNDLTGALAASVAAAREATDAGAPAEALQHLESALELWTAVPDPEKAGECDEVTLHQLLREAASSAGDPERSLAYARSAVVVAERGGDPVAIADTLQRLAHDLFWRDGEEPEGLELIERAWTLVEDREPSRTKAWVLAVRGSFQRWRDFDGDQSAARRSLEQAIEVGRIGKARGAETDALITLAGLETGAGRVVESNTALRLARQRAAELGCSPAVELRALLNYGMNCDDEGLLTEARQAYAEGVDFAVLTGLASAPYGVSLRLHLAIADYALGHWEDAAEQATSSAESDLTLATLAAAQLGRTVGCGDFATAEPLVEQLWSRRIADAIVVHLIATAGVELAMWSGHPERGLEYAMEARARTDELTQPPHASRIKLGTLGLAAAADLAADARRRRNRATEQEAIARGREFLDEVRLVAAEVRPRNGQLGPEGRAWIARAEAEASRLENAGDPARWAAAVEAFAYGHRYQQALARWRLAAALFEADRRTEATEELRHATQVAHELGAVPLAEALSALARRARISVDATTTIPMPVDDLLTPRELAVLQQVAQGNTNRQVGEQLFISEKTVSVHLSRVMAKLGAASRTEAVAVAYDRGLLS